MMFANNQAESPVDDRFRFEEVIKEIDSIIAKCMTDITHTDREQSYLSVHGISDEFDETPDVVERALAEMKSQIEKIPNKQALDRAEAIDSKYVHDPSLQLKFLRGTRFNVAKAAAKFVRHFDLKLQLFGESKLVKDIEQEDLSDGDIKTLYSGFNQWLPLRDISGGTVAVFFPASNDFSELPHLSNVCIFSWNVVSIYREIRLLMSDFSS